MNFSEGATRDTGRGAATRSRQALDAVDVQHERPQRRSTSFTTRPIPWPESLNDAHAASVPGPRGEDGGQPVMTLVVVGLAETGTVKIEVTANQARHYLARQCSDELSEAA